MICLTPCTYSSSVCISLIKIKVWSQISSILIYFLNKPPYCILIKDEFQYQYKFLDCFYVLVWFFSDYFFELFTLLIFNSLFYFRTCTWIFVVLSLSWNIFAHARELDFLFCRRSRYRWSWQSLPSVWSEFLFLFLRYK
jgi:hypothetical protein